MIAKRVVLIICVVNGFCALIFGVLMALSPDGSLIMMQELVPAVQALPLPSMFIQDLLWPGIALFLVNGVANLTAFVLLTRKKDSGYKVGLFAGVLLICWCTFELIFMFNFISVFYLLVGIAQTIAAILVIKKIM